MSVENQTVPPPQSAGGVERTRKVAERLGVLDLAPRVITVGGTNGKGSTVAFAEAIGTAAGLRVGIFTTPHIFRYNESVRIDKQDVGDRELLLAFHHVKAVSMGLDPAAVPLDPREFMSAATIKSACLGGDKAVIPLFPYELLTLVALWIFKQAKLDLVVLEVGVGGRWDAVNVIDADVAIITTVDLDHTQVLGADRDTIGLNKVGIARSGHPLVIGELDPPTQMLDEAHAIGAKILRAGQDYRFGRRAEGWFWQDEHRTLELPMPSLVAPVQIANAAATIAAMLTIDAALSDDAIAAGVATASLPGRLQRIVRGDTEVFLDIGHNRQAAKELAAWAAAGARQGRLLAVFGTAVDKDVEGIAAELADSVDHWYLAGMETTHKRELDANSLARRMESVIDASACSSHDTLELALKSAYADVLPSDRVLVFGSPGIIKAAMTEAQ